MVLGLGVYPVELFAQTAGEGADQDEISQHLDAGRAALKKGKYKQAVSSFSKANKLAKGSSIEAYLGLASASLRRGDNEKTSRYSNQALKLAVTPFHQAVALNLVGLAHWEISQEVRASSDRETNLAEAEASFRQALLVSREEMAVAWSNLALVLEAQNRLSEAQSALKEYLERVPEDRSARNRLCWVHFSAQEVSPHARDDQNLSAIKLGSNVLPPRKIYAPQPLYTEEARQERIQGVVILEAVIDKHGSVQNVKILKGLPHGLSESAVRTACGWEFEPATLAGETVAVYFNLTTRFSLE